MNSDFTHIEELLRENKPEDALVLLDRVIAADAENAEALFLRGKAYWRLGERAKATSDYAASAMIEPGGKAAAALEHARDIEDFFNPDLLNP